MDLLYHNMIQQFCEDEQTHMLDDNLSTASKTQSVKNISNICPNDITKDNLKIPVHI